eukprot:UN09495
MTFIIQSGKSFYWGTSEWTAQQITEAYWIAQVKNLIPPVVEQPQYNLFERTNIEKNFLRLFKLPYGMGATTWSPLKSGVLTGKYNKKIPDGSRMAEKSYEWLAKRWEQQKEQQIPVVEKLIEFARDRLNTSVTCLAIAWCIKNKNVSSVLLGATKEKQIEENLKALDIAKKLSSEMMDEIDVIVGTKPVQMGHYGRFLENKTNPL